MAWSWLAEGSYAEVGGDDEPFAVHVLAADPVAGAGDEAQARGRVFVENNIRRHPVIRVGGHIRHDEIQLNRPIGHDRDGIARFEIGNVLEHAGKAETIVEMSVYDGAPHLP